MLGRAGLQARVNAATDTRAGGAVIFDDRSSCKIDSASHDAGLKAGTTRANDCDPCPNSTHFC
jgi:hypothetical protein